MIRKQQLQYSSLPSAPAVVKAENIEVHCLRYWFYLSLYNRIAASLLGLLTFLLN